MKGYFKKMLAIVVSFFMVCTQMTPMIQNKVYASEGIRINRDEIEELSSKTKGPAGDGDNIEDSFDGVVDRKFTSSNWMRGERSNEYYITLKDVVKFNKVRIHPRLNWMRDKVEKCEVYFKALDTEDWTLAGSGMFSATAAPNEWLDPIEFESVYAKYIKIYIESSSGCVSTAEVELYKEDGEIGDIELEKPKVTITGESSNNIYSSIEKITLSDNEALASVTINGKETTLTGTTFEITANELEKYGIVEGKNTIVVMDTSDNKTTVIFTFNIDHIDPTVREIVDAYQPMVDEDDVTLALPEFEGYTFEIYGSDNEQVIATDGTITRPLNDMEVNIMIKAVNDAYPEDVVISSGNKFVTVEGLYDNTGRNAKPVVEPALREWYGAESGNFVFNDNAQVVLDSAYENELAPMQEILATDFSEIVGRTVNVEFNDANNVQAGDVFITLSGETSLGEEGNFIEIDDSITIKACTYTGAFWGTRSVLQIMKLNGNTVPMGIARDYPRYATRGFMFDVARKYAPMSYLYDVMKTMSWYKMNSFQIHLSDDKGERHDAFRLENETYPGLTADDGFYTKDEFRQFTKDSLTHGITIIPEFDVPGHSTCFVRIRPDLRNPSSNGSELDVTNPNTLPFVKTIFDEYIDGDDPVFVNDMIHFGADEFTGDSMGYINFLKDMIEYMESKGKHGAFWNSFGDHPVPDDFDMPSNATGYVWYPGGDNSAHGLLDQGMSYINVDSTQLYIVPCDDGSTGTYRDFIRNESIYNTWKVSNHDNVPSAHPGQLGSMFACWQDHANTVRYTNYEIFDMWFPSISVIAQRTWSQENQLNYATFKNTSETLGCGPDVTFDDIYPEANDEKVVLNYDFENGEAKDMSGNNNNGTLTETGVAIENDPEQGNVATFDGTGNIETNLKAIKWPYTVSFDIKADTDNVLGATIFSSPRDNRYAGLPEDYKYDFLDGALLLKQGKNGNLGFAREMAVVLDESGYDNWLVNRNAFDFGTALASDEWHNITMTAQRHEIILYIDGVEVSRLVQQKHPLISSYNMDMSFVLPLKLIGKDFKGAMDNITVYNDIVKPAAPVAKYAVTIDETIENGTISTNASKVEAGKTVVITATPNENYRLKDGSMKVYKTEDLTTEVAVTNQTFVMPAFDVTVTAEFESMLADYSAVDAAIAHVPADLTVYTDESQAALQAALDAVVRDLDASKQAEVDAMAEAINVAIDNLEKAIYTITVNGEVAATGAYNEKVTITAPASDQVFTGWMLNGTVVSTQPEYTFFISEDMEFTPCYEEVTLAPEVMLTNTILTRRDTKADVKFVAQLVLPKGYTLVNAGLVWSSKEDTVLDLANAKTTYITRISNTDQFSVTIKGMPAGRFIRGKIFATVVDDEGNETVVYSDESRVVNK